jgi:hypothetical protein
MTARERYHRLAHVTLARIAQARRRKGPYLPDLSLPNSITRRTMSSADTRRRSNRWYCYAATIAPHSARSMLCLGAESSVEPAAR